MKIQVPGSAWPASAWWNISITTRRINLPMATRVVDLRLLEQTDSASVQDAASGWSARRPCARSVGRWRGWLAVHMRGGHRHRLPGIGEVADTQRTGADRARDARGRALPRMPGAARSAAPPRRRPRIGARR